MAAQGQGRLFFAAELAASVTRAVLLAFAITIAAWDGSANAQGVPPKRLGILALTACPVPGAPPSFFRRRLAELGWIEGRNLIIDCASAARQPDQLAALAAELVARRPDVLVASSPPPVRALKQATTTIPIVMNSGEALGLVANLARPEANVTGVIDLAEGLFSKRTEILREVLPRLTRLAILFRKGGDAAALAQLERDATTAAAPLRFTWRIFYPAVPEDFDAIFGQLAAEAFDAAYVPAGPQSYDYQARIGELAKQYRVATAGDFPVFAKNGFLLTYGVDFNQILARLADYVDKILRGAKPGDLPVEQPTKFQLVVNLQTAKALGLIIPESFLLRADEVIE
jgi:putative tryptophan/tyrosine transport system substrate-binding protein